MVGLVLSRINLGAKVQIKKRFQQGKRFMVMRKFVKCVRCPCFLIEMIG